MEDRLGVVNEIPVPNEVPPVEAEYQLITPEDAVAPKVTVPAPQRTPGVVPVMVATVLTVSDLVELTAPQGPEASVVKVSVIIPS